MSPCGMPCHCLPARVPVRIMWQLEKDTSHIPADLEYNEPVHEISNNLTF